MDFKSVRLFFHSLAFWSLAIGITFSAEAQPWQEYQAPQQARTALKTNAHQNARWLTLDETEMRLALQGSSQTANHTGTTSAKKITSNIVLPVADGTMLSLEIEPSTVLPEQLAKQFESIKTYQIIPNKQVATGRIDMTPNGFHAMLQMRAGDTFFIDPEKTLISQDGQGVYVSYRKQDQHQDRNSTYSCGAKVSEFSAKDSGLSHRAYKGADETLLNYKIAVAATGEYVEKNGGTVDSALAAIVSTLNRVNQVYENDLGIHLTLVENNHLLIYPDAQSDPFNATDTEELLAQNQRNLDAVIGNKNYDIGHLFTTSGGGLAAIGSVCNSYIKGKGVSGTSEQGNDSFNLDFVAHEIAHQLGATHTFNGEEGLCSGDTRAASTAFEPGSGSTIMSYAGYCGSDNLQANTDAMLHIGSIEQIRYFTVYGGGSRCGIRHTATNSAPTVNAGNNYIIPAQTPFELEGRALDRDDDLLRYAWEQIDAGNRSDTYSDTGNNALFRAYLPDDSLSRSFPPMGDLLAHDISRGERLPVQQRILNFSFVAQDGFNPAQSDEMQIQVLRTGSRFALNLPRSAYNRGETEAIYWNTAGTEKPPINCESVDIFLSSNGGLDFDRLLEEGVANTGEAWITIPADAELTTRARFKISCSDNIFFAVSYRNFIVKDSDDELGTNLNDENEPEDNLADKVLKDKSKVQQSDSPIKENEAGGAFGGFFLLFLIIIGSPRIKNLYTRY